MLFASSIAAKVSAVSPDCDIAIITSSLLIIGFLYLNSEAYSTSTGILVKSSKIYSPINPACQEVPQAIIIIRFEFINLLEYSEIPPNLMSLFIKSRRPRIVSTILLGCSYISFNIKCGKPSFSIFSNFISSF